MHKKKISHLNAYSSALTDCTFHDCIAQLAFTWRDFSSEFESFYRGRLVSRPDMRFLALNLMLLIVNLLVVGKVSAHGRLIEPPSRASMWRYGFDTPHDYNDHECYCGGFTRQWQRNKGKCGICGDPWDSPTVSPSEKNYAKCQSKPQDAKQHMSKTRIKVSNKLYFFLLKKKKSFWNNSYNLHIYVMLKIYRFIILC